MTDMTADPFGAPGEPQHERPTAPPTAPRDYTSLSLPKIALIGGLAIATILPNLFITNLIEEREARQVGVKHEFTRVNSCFTPTWRASRSSIRLVMKRFGRIVAIASPPISAIFGSESDV